jgi:hypothetical protein
MVEKITLKCACCHKEFQKALNAYNMRKNIGQKHFYCSKQCNADRKKIKK